MNDDEVVRIEELALDRILELRRTVLRNGTATSDPRYVEDGLPDTVHLGVVRDGTVIATSTWLPRESPDSPGTPAIQLKGMAVDPSVQSRGVGSMLLNAGISRAVDLGAHLVWARARDTALRFYQSHRFVIVGGAFIDEHTGLSHHVVSRRVHP